MMMRQKLEQEQADALEDDEDLFGDEDDDGLVDGPLIVVPEADGHGGDELDDKAEGLAQQLRDDHEVIGHKMHDEDSQSDQSEQEDMS